MKLYFILFGKKKSLSKEDHMSHMFHGELCKVMLQTIFFPLPQAAAGSTSARKRLDRELRCV